MITERVIAASDQSFAELRELCMVNGFAGTAIKIMPFIRRLDLDAIRNTSDAELAVICALAWPSIGYVAQQYAEKIEGEKQ